jgi:hypothetical protein
MNPMELPPIKEITVTGPKASGSISQILEPPLPTAYSSIIN